MCPPCSLVAAHSQPASEPSGQTETHRHNALDIHTYSHYTLSFLSSQSRHPQHASESTTTVSPSHPTKQSTTSTQRKEAPLGRHTSDTTRRLGKFVFHVPFLSPSILSPFSPSTRSSCLVLASSLQARPSFVHFVRQPSKTWSSLSRSTSHYIYSVYTPLCTRSLVHIQVLSCLPHTPNSSHRASKHARTSHRTSKNRTQPQ